MKEITYDDTRDIAIRCVESLIGMGILEDYEDCNGTFEVQDLIQIEIISPNKKEIEGDVTKSPLSPNGIFFE